MQRYVILCEIASHTILKRIYKTKEEAQHYLKEVHEQIVQEDPPSYRILSETEDELLIEDTGGKELQRRYYIYGGKTADVIDFLSHIFGDDAKQHDNP